MTAIRTTLTLLSLAVLAAAAPLSARAQAVLFHDGFARPNGLITNDYATSHPNGKGAKESEEWLALSGSIFAMGHAAWTGVPDNHIPQAGETRPTSGTRSAKFRVVTQAADLGDVAVTFDLFNQGLVSGPKTPKKPYDGVHVLLRYQSDDQFYSISVNRRDDTISIKKKIQSGVYVDLTPALPLKVKYNRWRRVTVAARDEADGRVTLQAFVDGKLVASAVDAGLGGPALRGRGRVGLRGDNCEFLFGNFTVTALPGSLPAAQLVAAPQLVTPAGQAAALPPAPPAAIPASIPGGAPAGDGPAAVAPSAPQSAAFVTPAAFAPAAPAAPTAQAAPPAASTPPSAASLPPEPKAPVVTGGVGAAQSQFEHP